MMFTIPKGTKDMLPGEAYKWHFVEQAARETAALFGFREIRTPTFEQTELFTRGVGETTDIVTKEMYTFLDKGGRSITLKPEGTAGVARAYVSSLQGEGLIPMKMYYLTSVFRYERPQSGRLREHHQFGCELYGSSSPSADAEVIALAKTFFEKVGLKSLSLNINSIGCPECRKEYNKVLKEYLSSHLDSMCAQCKVRFDKNPLRILDCKEENCKAVNKNAPKITDYLCDECKKHFDGVKENLTALGIEFKVNPDIVRGLDYYTRTVFEFITDTIGAQGTVCGGGRYDNLVAEVGGAKTPAVGFGLGIERLILTMEAERLFDTVKKDAPKVYVASFADTAAEASRLVMSLRK
ncbi:MAG: histidine--tRNA ligase, partial [Clostridiales bacterium]|nr:histidine--tRNA ligase [Clostridiales bacterium]